MFLAVHHRLPSDLAFLSWISHAALTSLVSVKPDM